MSIWRAARIAAAAMLFLALFEMPDEYYKALRFVVTAAAIMEIYQFQRGNLSQGKKTAWTLAFAAVAIVFNPLMPLEMDREAWAVFDVVGAGLFGFWLVPEKFWDELKRQYYDDSSVPPPLPSVKNRSEITSKRIAIIFGSTILFITLAWGTWALIAKEVDRVRWEYAITRSQPDDSAGREMFREIQHWRLIFSSAEYRKYLVGDKLKDALSPDVAMMSSANFAFFGWALGTDLSDEGMGDLKKEWFEEGILDQELFALINDEISDCQDGIITLGKMEIDIADRLAFPKGIYPDDIAAAEYRRRAVSIIRQ